MSNDLSDSLGAVERRKEKLVGNVKNVVADADGLVKDLAHSTAEGFLAARAGIEAEADEAMTRLEHARTALVDQARKGATATQEYVSENPWRVLAAAAAAGLVVGFLLGRR